MSAIERQPKVEETDADAKASEPPSSGVRPALAIPRPRPRALPGKEVLPAPGVPETPRRERNKTSSFWPAPPEPMKPARPSKRGSPLTTTTHGFPEASLRAGAPAARKSSPPPRPARIAAAAEVESKSAIRLRPEAARAFDRVPPPPPSKRKHTDHGWPPPSVGALAPLPVEAPIASPASIAPEAPRAREIVVAEEPISAPIVAAPMELRSQSVDDDDVIELPFQRAAGRMRWIVAAVLVAAVLALVVTFAR